MGSITIPVKANDHPHLRPLNVLRDLSAVADLIEVCFSPTMDNDGQRYLSDMRRASRDDSFLRWASRMTETASLPLMGYVWEQDGRIIGNASLIPFRSKGKRVYLIANVATHPTYRRQGIGRALTERVMKQARDRRASAIWLRSNFIRNLASGKSPAAPPGRQIRMPVSHCPTATFRSCRGIRASGRSSRTGCAGFTPTP
jgi:predicted N-acetyltransferase YhbS